MNVDPRVGDALPKRVSYSRELIYRFEKAAGTLQIDSVIEEMALEVVVDGAPYRSLTCSPWNVRELVVGNLYTAGIVDAFDEVASVSIDEEAGFVEVATADGAGAPGRRSAGDVVDRVLCPEFDGDRATPVLVTAGAISEFMEFLEGNSRLFLRTGGVHNAAMVDASGTLLAWFEDIGRHNALDKLAGWALEAGVDASDKVLLFSGRVPREIIARAIRVGFPVVVSPGAPTDLSIRLAAAHGVTLVGFAKNGRFNVYTHPGRIG